MFGQDRAVRRSQKRPRRDTRPRRVGGRRFLVARSASAGGKFSKTFRFEDISYAVASKEDKEGMFLEYSELLNSFDSGATYKITVIVKRLDKEEFKQSIVIPLKGDALDPYQTECNKVLLDEVTGANDPAEIPHRQHVQEKRRGIAELFLPRGSRPGRALKPARIKGCRSRRGGQAENLSWLFHAGRRKRLTFRYVRPYAARAQL
ncbi:MAG: hypothetical protein LBU32_01400 [Clostridiales bacterium]|nr:hypothetical protein [Clostridiales bacterium]